MKLKISDYYKTQKLKSWQNSKIQIVTKLKITQTLPKVKDLNSDKTQNLSSHKMKTQFLTKPKKKSSPKKNLTPPQRMRCNWQYVVIVHWVQGFPVGYVERKGT